MKILGKPHHQCDEEIRKLRLKNKSRFPIKSFCEVKFLKVVEVGLWQIVLAEYSARHCSFVPKIFIK